MSNYKANKAKAIHFNNEPTMTDQSQAEQTDINIIVTQFIRTGQAPSGAAQPIYGDFSELPEDLRGFIEMGRSMNGLIQQLPAELQGIPVHELVRMTNEQITAILNPPDTQSDDKKDEK